ncbi:Bug family tripartite tricarboxylate transporter substrate binding protein [Falsiroseomonas sp. HW251]|uniref:Bug family tripartite tricarboxylate transporter substrate binding protein n=1 Tax=Falsiroseomonas sp. HW251 TaxID=3390998 RepID=UPI003D32287B
MSGTHDPRRRRLLLTTGALSAAAILPGAARAQDRYPNRPVRIVSQFAAGGPADIIARMIAERLQSRWGQPVVVENRIGAAGTIGATFVARSAPDGYTLLMATNTHVMNPTLIPNLQYDPLADFTPIMRVASYYMFLVCHPSVPAQNVQELIALAKRDPGRVTAATIGVGSVPHLAAALFALRGGIELTYVPYSGSAQNVLAVLNGEVNILFLGSLVMEHVRSGRLRVLGAGSPGPSPDAPGVPTIAEQGLPGFEAPVWFGMMGPKGMPQPLTERMYDDIRWSLDNDDVRARLLTQGIHTEDLNPQRFGARMAEEVPLWADVIRRANIRAG